MKKTGKFYFFLLFLFSLSGATTAQTDYPVSIKGDTIRGSNEIKAGGLGEVKMTEKLFSVR